MNPDRKTLTPDERDFLRSLLYPRLMPNGGIARRVYEKLKEPIRVR